MNNKLFLRKMKHSLSNLECQQALVNFSAFHTSLTIRARCIGTTLIAYDMKRICTQYKCFPSKVETDKIHNPLSGIISEYLSDHNTNLKEW